MQRYHLLFWMSCSLSIEFPVFFFFFGFRFQLRMLFFVFWATSLGCDYPTLAYDLWVLYLNNYLVVLFVGGFRDISRWATFLHCDARMKCENDTQV